ncbi:MAG: ATP-binding protein [bacterium]
MSMNNSTPNNKDYLHELQRALRLKKHRMVLIWSFKAGDDITSICQVDYLGKNEHQKQIVVGSRDHKIYSLSVKKEIIWEFTAHNEITSLYTHELLDDSSQLIVAGSLDSSVYVLDVNGNLLWNYTLNSPVTCVTATHRKDEDIIIAGTTSGTVYFIKYLSEIEWEFSYGTHCIINGICLTSIDTEGENANSSDYNNLIAATNKGNIIVLDIHRQQFLYNFALPDKGAVYSILAKDIDLDGQNELVISSDSCVVYMLDCYGRQKWQFQTKDSVYSVHCCDINHDHNYEILVGTKDNHVYILNSNGEFMWEYKTEHNVWSIYVGHLVNPNFYDVFASLSNKTVNCYKLVEIHQVSQIIEHAYKNLFNNTQEEMKLLEFLSNYEDEYLRGFARTKIVHFATYDHHYTEKVFTILEKGMHDVSSIVRSESIKSFVKMLDFEFDRSIKMMKDLLINEKDSEIRNDFILSIVHASLRIARTAKKTELYDLLNKLNLSWAQLEKKDLVNLLEMAKDDLMTGNYQKALENFEILLENKMDLIWKYPTAGFVTSITAHDIDSDGVLEIILSSRKNHVYIIDSKGIIKWEVKGSCNGIVVIKDNIHSSQAEIIIVYADGTIHIYSHDGTKKKEISLNLPINITHAAILRETDSTGKIILLCHDGSLKLFDLNNNALLDYTGHYSAHTICPFDINRDHNEEIIVGTRFGKVIVLDAEGSELQSWQCPHDTPIVAINAFHIKNTKRVLIIVGYSSGIIQAFNGKGKLQWEHVAGSSINDILIADFNNDGVCEILVSLEEQKIHILNYKGDTFSIIETQACIRCSAYYQPDQEGYKKLLLGGENEVLYAYNIMVQDELETYIQKCKSNVYKIEIRANFDRQSIFKTIKSTLEKSPPPQKIILNGFWGTGKSEIIWKINTGYLGEHFITAYFSGLNYWEFRDTHSFILKFIEVIEKSLKRLKINVWPTAHSPLEEDFDSRFNHFLNTVPRKVGTTQKILLLLDDYQLLEKEIKDGRLDNGIFYFFNKILASDKFTFIIAVSTGYIESSEQNECREFLTHNKEIIDVNFLERHEAEKGLTERLSDYTDHYNEIGEEIIELSGSHTFLIQVLLSEVIKYLQKNNITNLNNNDLENIIKSSMPRIGTALVRPWNSSDCYGKLVFTALAMSPNGCATCSQIRKNLGAFENLISDEKLNTLLKNFTYKGILKAMFTESEIKYTFSIPLFFIWVKDNHNLLDIMNEYSTSLLKDVPIKQFIKFDSQLKAERKTHIFLESIRFDLQRWAVLIKFCKKWVAVTEKKRHRRGKISDLSLLNGLVKFLASIFGLSIIKSETADELTLYRLGVPTFRLKKLQGMIMICFHKKNLDERDFHILLNKITHMGETERVFLILNLTDSRAFESRCKDSKLDLVLLQSKDILNILFSEDYMKAFIHDIILQRISIVDISPYETKGPAINLFFGRIKEIRTILQHQEKCYAIIGSRRLGKTSLLMQIHQRIAQNENLRTTYIDCSNYGMDQSHILLRFCRDVLARLDFGEIDIKELHDFKSYIIKCCKEHNVKIALFLDEIDELLAIDHRHKSILFNTLRGLYQEHYLTLIIAGYEELNSRIRDYTSPLFNFLEVITLTSLDKESSIKLINEPMQELGIDFEGNYTIIQAICNVTSCFPNLIQDLCDRLIKLISDKKKRRISLSDVEEIIEKVEFQNNIIDMFFQYLDTIGKIIVILMLDMQEFNSSQIDNELRSHGIELSLSELSEGINKIMLGSLIKREKRKYHFALPEFPSIFKNSMSPHFLLKRLLKEFKENYTR